ncbi:RNA methyltransferase [Aureimonas fodinaquatilis]|uniref:RNA methyltransferase n=1 Tax=Aureimonas fodinaquatilis TaxID=2565783 RepID=A0A5B0DXS3_9HYPH|nr:RNA methyltransferase [Aureimonas fodinaquatilis]KAA0971273.1 RNA methyltransferase [Aureimonas fodinaquatilis]
MSKQPSSHTPKDSHYARLRRAHRDRHAEPAKPAVDGIVRLYGLHTVVAALANPRRKLIRLYATRNAVNRLEIDPENLSCPFELVEPRVLDSELGSDAVHQGVMLETRPLPPLGLDHLDAADLVLVLDQVTDPHNVGAILRSATAFGAGAVVTTTRHSPQESGVLAKSASGALEEIPYLQVVNLAEVLEDLTRRGFQTIGLDSDGPMPLEQTFNGKRFALVLGSEGKGLRQKTRATVDALARLEAPGAIRSLNVSNAAAVALYAARRAITS